MPIISGNSSISNVHYSGYTISKIYACGGSLVWSGTPTPTGTYRMKIKKIDDSEVYSYCDGAYSGWSYINQTEIVNTVGASDIFDALDSIASIDFGNCPILTGFSFGAGAHVNNSITSVTFTDTSITDIGTGFELTKSLESIDIPDSITSMTGNFAGSGIRTATIGKGLTSLPDAAFAACANLRSIDIPNSITSIGENTFGGCSSLNSVTFNDDSVTTIETRAFCSCTSLRTFDTPSGVTKLENSTFSGCTGLRTIDLKKVNTLGNEVFRGCTSLHTVNLSGVTTLGAYNFSGCTSLSSVTLSDRLIRIPQGSFYSCSSLSSMTLPNSVKYIDNYVFNNCSALTSVNLENVEEIGNYAFLGCNSLTSLSLDKAVTIGQNAFMARGLTDITIGEDIVNIGTQAFGNSGMQAGSVTFTILATIPPIISSSGFVYNKGYINAIYVPDAVLGDYLSDWSQYADKLKPLSEKP